MSTIHKTIISCDECSCFFETVTNSVIVLRIEAAKHGWDYRPGDKKTNRKAADLCPRCIMEASK